MDVLKAEIAKKRKQLEEKQLLVTIYKSFNTPSNYHTLCFLVGSWKEILQTCRLSSKGNRRI